MLDMRPAFRNSILLLVLMTTPVAVTAVQASKRPVWVGNHLTFLDEGKPLAAPTAAAPAPRPAVQPPSYSAPPAELVSRPAPRPQALPRPIAKTVAKAKPTSPRLARTRHGSPRRPSPVASRGHGHPQGVHVSHAVARTARPAPAQTSGLSDNPQYSELVDRLRKDQVGAREMTQASSVSNDVARDRAAAHRPSVHAAAQPGFSEFADGFFKKDVRP